MEVYLAQPRGFCAGVVRAIEIVERALEKYGPPVYVRHEIVHNKYVVESLKAKGAIFVEDLSEVPAQAVTVFSAHGVARSVEEEEEPDAVSPGRAAVERGARTAMVYFGLVDDEEHNRRSRYGEVSSALDRDLDALRERVAELEARLDALTPSPRDGEHESRLKDLAEDPHGIYDCTHCFACVEVCPKDVAPMNQITRLRRRAIQRLDVFLRRVARRRPVRPARADCW